jgi:hypothetical protein
MDGGQATAFIMTRDQGPFVLLPPSQIMLHISFSQSQIL